MEYSAAKFLQELIVFAASSNHNARLESFLKVREQCHRFDYDMSTNRLHCFHLLVSPHPGLDNTRSGLCFSIYVNFGLGLRWWGVLGRRMHKGLPSAIAQRAKPFTLNCLPSVISSAIVSLCWGDCGAWLQYGCECQWLGILQLQHVFSCCSQP